MKRKKPKLIEVNCYSCARGPFTTLYHVGGVNVCEQCRNDELMKIIQIALMPIRNVKP